MFRKPVYQHAFIGKEKVGFSKCYHAEWDEDLGDDAAQLILNIDIRSTSIPGEEVAAELFDVFKNNFFQDLEKDPYSRFEESLKMMNDIIVEKESEYGTKFLPNMSTVVAVVTGGTLYLSQHGDAEAYLVRKRHVNIISEGLHEGTTSGKELFANIASGGVVPGDRLVYSTARLYRYVTKMDMAKIFSDNDLKDSLVDLHGFVSMDATDRISVCAVGIVGGEGHAPVAEIPDSKPKRAKGGWYSKFSGVFADNKVLSFVSEKIADLRHLLDKWVENKGALSEWRRLGRDKVLLSLILVVIVLVAGIYLVRNQGHKQQYIEDLEAQLVSVSDKIDEAETKGTYDKSSAEKLLNDAEDMAMEVLASGYLRASASQYLSSIEEQRDYLDNVIRVPEVTMYADLSEKRSTVSALGIIPYDGSLYVYEYNGLYEIELGEVQDPLTIDDEKVVIDGAAFEDQNSILFYTEDGGIIEYDGFVFNFMDAESGFKSGIDVVPYATKVYVLDPIGSQIWKYYRQRASYGSAESYLLADDVDLSGAVSMSIDGSVWILNSDGTITKLLSGVEEDFNIDRSPLTSFAGATKIHTAYEMSQLYVLDPANSRVLVFNKDAKTGGLVYSTQYVFEGLDDIRDIYISQAENRMYLLTGDKVWYYGY